MERIQTLKNTHFFPFNMQTIQNFLCSFAAKNQIEYKYYGNSNQTNTCSNRR